MFGAPLFRVTKLEAPIAAASSGPLVTWRWPRKGIVRSLSIGVKSGDLAELAALELAITMNGEHYATSGRSVERLPGLLAVGEQWWHPMGAPVNALDPWAIQFVNTGAVQVVPRLLFWLDPPR